MKISLARHITACVFFLYSLFSALMAQTYTISGYIRDAAARESLIGATVLDGRTGKGTTSNSYGFYSLTLPRGEVELRFSYLGYETTNYTFSLRADTAIQILLKPAVHELQQIVVEAGNTPLRTTRTGTVNIPIAQIKNMPSLLGENDLMKSLQLLPGVQTTSEGKSDLSVRGGSPDQNLILLDGIPIYNANHLYGFLSIFNTDAIKNVTLYKSGFPARFGGRLSSVVDIHTNDGNKERIEGSASVGLLAMKANIEGPLIKDKTSFTFSVRRTYLDLFMDKITDWINESNDAISNDNKYNMFFYDINAKLHHRFSDRTSLYIMGYSGRDKLHTTYNNKEGKWGQLEAFNRQDWKWGSNVAALRLNHVLSGNLFLNGAFSFNDYHYSTLLNKNYIVENVSGEQDPEKIYNNFNYKSGIRDYSTTLDVDYIPHSSHYIRGGASVVLHRFRPEVITSKSEGILDEADNYISGGVVPATEMALYVEDDWEITSRLKANIGFRYSFFQVQGKGYHGFDPRLSLRYLLTDRIALRAGYSDMKQYIHLLSSNTMVLQTDLWVPVTQKVKPMHSRQYAAGVFFQLPHTMEFSVETYYKGMENVIEYKDGASFTGVSGGWENQVEAGKGRSYGVEFSLQKRAGKSTGWISYTLARTERLFDQINYGEWFPAKYDRRHNLAVTLSRKLGDKIDVSGSWTYTTGSVITLPLMRVEQGIIPEDPFPEQVVVDQVDHRNNYRQDAYHRLDVGLNYYTSVKKRRYGIINLSVYNVYNRMNSLLLYSDFEEDSWGDKKRVLKRVTLFPIMPSLSFTYKF